ncbi:hypothetical protein AB0I81_03960 [Nonomuraea sp. NPDC050404]|uniref:hypothetical protein n=1 Tax=Nonomuraea sp. NPDC050404 TaxID=3155783 RepID=UPI0033F8B379
MTMGDLREVLRERADGPSPANPRRHDEVRSRIRGRRRRRRAAAGALTGVAAAAAVVVTVSLLPGASPDDTTALTRPGPSATNPAEKGLPERFTAPDGTEYRRVATAAITGEKKASVKVPVSGLPLEVAALCVGDRDANSPRVWVDGRFGRVGDGFGPCRPDRELQPLTVPEGAEQVTVTFDTTTSGRGCVRKVKGGPCLEVQKKEGGWRLAVYEWTPPSRPVTPEPVRAFPERLAGKKLAATATGVYPQDDTIELKVTSTTGRIGFDQLCSGDLADRMRFTLTIDGEKSPATSGCGVWKQGEFPMAMSEHRIPKGREVTVTGRIEIQGEHTNRPIAWGVGAYRD